MTARRTTRTAVLAAAVGAGFLAMGCVCSDLWKVDVPMPVPDRPASTAAPALPDVAVRKVLLPSATNPLIAVRLVFEVGSVDDPTGKEGLAALTASLMARGGGGDRTYSQMLDALYPMAASIDQYTTRETTVFSGIVHKDNVDAYLAILLDQILTPRFEPADLDRLRLQASDYVTKTLRGDDDEELGKHALHAHMYAGHPYAHPARGTAQGLQAITAADVVDFHRRYFARDALVLGVSGGFADDLPDQLAARLSALAARRPAREALPVLSERDPGMHVLIVEKATRSAAISMGHPLDITRADDDFYPLLVAASYLGEHRTFNGVLMNNMRGKRGLNYGDYAYIESFLQEGWSTFPRPNVQRRQQHFEIWIRPVAPHNAAFAVRQAVYETDKLIREGIPEKGFEDTRQFLSNYSRLWTQGANRRLGYAIDEALVGREIAAELQARLPTITREQVNAAVRKHLSVDSLYVAIAAADGAGLEAALASGEKTPIVYDTEGTPPEILAEDAVIEVFALPIAADRMVVQPAGDLFER